MAGCSALKNSSSCAFHAPDTFHVGNQREEVLRPSLLEPSYRIVPLSV